MASTKGSTAPAGTSQPDFIGSTSSGIPAMYVLTTGRPSAKDSMITTGSPSAKLGSTSAREATTCFCTSAPLAQPVPDECLDTGHRVRAAAVRGDHAANIEVAVTRRPARPVRIEEVAVGRCNAARLDIELRGDLGLGERGAHARLEQFVQPRHGRDATIERDLPLEAVCLRRHLDRLRCHGPRQVDFGPLAGRERAQQGQRNRDRGLHGSSVQARRSGIGRGTLPGMTPQRLLMLIAVTGLAAAAGFLTYRAAVVPGPVPVPTAARATVAASPGEADAAEEDNAPPPPVIPDTLPRFTLKDRDGVPRTLANWSGHPLLVNFWATWCPPCRDEMPGFSRLQQQYGGNGVQFVGISIDEASKIIEFQKETPVTYPLLIADLPTMQSSAGYGNRAQALPFTAVFDGEGRLAATRLGRWDEADLEREVRARTTTRPSTPTTSASASSTWPRPEPATSSCCRRLVLRSLNTSAANCSQARQWRWWRSWRSIAREAAQTGPLRFVNPRSRTAETRAIASARSSTPGD